jgi:hypothetical protein
MAIMSLQRPSMPAPAGWSAADAEERK